MLSVSASHNLDDQDSVIGFYCAVTKYVDRLKGRNRVWWIKRHEGLGCSPNSALCDGRYEAVHEAWLSAGSSGP